MSAAEDNNNDAQTQDKLTLAQLAAIENEIKSSQPLTSQLLPISALLHQYSSDTNVTDEHQQSAGFIQAAQFLSTKYTSLRRVRGDGNCYYRAFLYSLCEHLLRNHNRNNGSSLKEFWRIKATVVDSLKWVCQYGYDEMTIDMFYEELVELFDLIEETSLLSANNNNNSSSVNNDDEANVDAAAAQHQLHIKLNEENSTSDYCTWYLRVLTAAQMKSNPDRFLPFLLADEIHYGNNMDIPSFCSREVEPMGKECGMVTVAALAECLGVKVLIEYMDGRLSNGREVVNHVFGNCLDDGDGGSGNNCLDEDRICLTLLYRPGHYDILY
jgi:ubiquitin thioesterase protein OTUB1